MGSAADGSQATRCPEVQVGLHLLAADYFPAAWDEPFR
jgi:hypothetical protein